MRSPESGVTKIAGSLGAEPKMEMTTETKIITRAAQDN
jgi:hypothetical protein